MVDGVFILVSLVLSGTFVKLRKQIRGIQYHLDNKESGCNQC